MNQAAIDAARRQFEEERLFPYKQVQFMQSLLQGLPLEAQQRSFVEPSAFSQLSGNISAIQDAIDVFAGGGGGGGGAQTLQEAMDAAVAAGEIDQATADAILAGAS